MHDYHEALEGFDPRQIWHDGCAECEERGETLNIGALDRNNFARAWERAAEFNQGGSSGLAISRAEAPLLNMLWKIQVQLERRGWPLGAVPFAPHSEPVEPERFDMSGATPGAER